MKNIAFDKNYFLEVDTSYVINPSNYTALHHLRIYKKFKKCTLCINEIYVGTGIIKYNIEEKNAYIIDNEINALKRLQGEKHIAKLIKLDEILFYKYGKYLCLEYYKGGDLQDYLSSQYFTPCNVDKVIVIMKQLIKAVKNCHKHNVVHADIKLENIIFKKYIKSLDINELKENIILIDFGSSVIIDRHDDNKYHITQLIKRITPYYIAPEMNDPSIFLEQKDILYYDYWCIGIVCYLLLTGKYPFSMINVNEKRYNIVYPKNSPIPDHIKIFILNLLQYEPLKRKFISFE